ncbi:MAG: hypothetical protein ABSD82_10605, partial [Solirubrobacteraceae bacterium]
MDIGNCVAVGFDIQGPSDSRPLVASETDGVWGAAFEVALPADAGAEEQGVNLNADACTSTGNCVAVGSYQNASGDGEALILNETAGTWGPAVGIAAPSGGTSAVLEGLACTSDGNCVAGGSYGTGAFASMPLLVSEVNGVWGAARTLTLPAGADGGTGQRAGIGAIACPSAGNCVAIGGYSVGAPGFGEQVMVAQQSSGWTTSQVVLPSGADPTNPDALLDSVACDATGKCVAVGTYSGTYDGGAGGEEGLIASGGTSGAWTAGQLTSLPDATNSASLGTVTCTGGGYCVAGGDLSNAGQPLVATGTTTAGASSWTATEIANPSGQDNGEITQVACASSGDCEAIGSFAPNPNAAAQVLLASETGGVWSQASELTLPPGANTADGQGLQDGGGLACAPSGDCVGAGGYEDASGNAQAWVASESGGTWGPASEVTLPPQTPPPSAPSATTSASTTTTSTTSTETAAKLTPAPPPAGLSASDLGSPTSGALNSGVPLTLSSSAGPGTAVVSVPAGALPTGTVISVYPLVDAAPLAAAVPAGQSYVVSFAISWLAPGGTSPAATSPITLTVSDPSITAGETIYDLTSSGLVDVGFATENGVATITLTRDPVFVVASLTARRLSLKDHDGVTIIG